MFSTIKVYLYGLLGLLVAGLGIAVKVLVGRNSRLHQKVETADAKIHHAKAVVQKTKENEVELRSRTADLAKEIEETKTSSELENPNEW